MSTHEIESKVREPRHLQALIDETQAEADAIRDAIKVYMARLRSFGLGSTDYLENCKVRQNRYNSPEKDPPLGSMRACQSI